MSISFENWANDKIKSGFSFYPEIEHDRKLSWIKSEIKRDSNHHVCHKYPIHCPLCAMEQLLSGYREFIYKDAF